MKTWVCKFIKSKRGSVSVEYVLLFLPMILFVIASLQITIAYHFALTAQKAVEVGARIAAVRDPVRTDLPAINERQGGFGGPFANGNNCSAGACANPGGPWVCDGAGLDVNCDAAAFNDIYNQVAQVAYLLAPEDMTITYDYGQLGFVGGPFVPLITVSINESPFFLSNLFLFNFGGSNDDPVTLTLPGVAATAIAEDLDSGS